MKKGSSDNQYLIFIDTNIVYNDFYFKSNEIKKLIQYTKHTPAKLWIKSL